MRSKAEPWIRDDEHGIGKVLIPRSPWSNAYADIARSERIGALRLSYSAGFRGDSIEFIADLPFLRSLEIYSFDVQDISPIKHLANLEVLGLETKSATGLDTWVAPLRVALVRWCKGLSFLFARSTLEYLNVVNYPHENLHPLSTLTRLRRLSITSRKLTSFEGIERLPILEHLDCYNCPNLVSVEPARTKTSMKHLEIEACQHVSKDLLA